MNASKVSMLFQQYKHDVKRWIHRRTRHQAHVEDLTQEVYLRLLRFAPDEAVKPRSYLFRMAANVVSDFNARQARSFISYDSEMADAQVWFDATDPADGLDNEDALQSILAELPKRHRAVLLMIKRDGLSHAQVAKKLKISPFTVRKYIGLAYAHVRARSQDDR